LVEFGGDPIPGVLVRLRTKFVLAQAVWEIHGRVGEVVLAVWSLSCSVRAWQTVRL
jgi:hypothetical protein